MIKTIKKDKNKLREKIVLEQSIVEINGEK